MRRAVSPELRGEQRLTQRLLPGQILQSALLELPLPELEARVEEEVASNPAIEMADGPRCAACGHRLARGFCTGCGAAPPRLAAGEWSDTLWDQGRARGDDRGDEPDGTPWPERIADSAGFRSLLLREARLLAAPEDRPLLTSMIENLDGDGYLREDLWEMAAPLHRTIPDAEGVLRLIQSLDPPGIGARDLRECLRIQAERLVCEAAARPGATAPAQPGVDPPAQADGGPAAHLLLRLIDEGWDLIGSRRAEALAKRVGVDLAAVQEALHLLRTRLTPCPLGALPEPVTPWSGSAPVRPDLRFSLSDAGIAVEVPDTVLSWLRIDPEYRRWSRRLKGAASAEAAYLRETIGSARALLDGIARRRRTLLSIGEALAERQEGFLRDGPRSLRPLTRRDVAAGLGLHESTVSRAVAGKWAELPSGEAVPLDRFFHAAASPKELLADLVAAEDPKAPLSDSDLMRALEGQGFALARRTVAKYREALGIPPVELRRA